MKVAFNGTTSRLYQTLVVGGEARLQRRRLVLGPAASTAARSASTRLRRQGVPSTRSRLGSTESCRNCATSGVTAEELERAKKAYIAEFIYEFDSQSSLARRYGQGMLLGLTIEQINAWPAAISKVTVEDVKRAAAKHLDIRRSVTGWLIPAAPDSETLPR